ncbi:MAG: hypothetical protein MZV63_14995 [Marinilabiliales bacterium]|nr:hypothetical protein [Marinilabiliales bacterium]
MIHGSKKPVEGSILLGESLMKDLRMVVGDSISLMYPMTQGVSSIGIVPIQQQFKVSGIIRTGYYEMDKALVIMTDKDAFSFYHILPIYSYLEVSLTDKYIDRVSEIEADISRKLGHDYTIKTWVEFNGNLFSLINMEKWLISPCLQLPGSDCSHELRQHSLNNDN